MSYKIHKATVKDIETFFSFFEKSIQTEFLEYTLNTRRYFIEEDYSKKLLKKEIQKKQKILFLASNKEKILGFLLVSKIYGGVAFGNWIVVDKEYQGQGIGTALLQTWEKQALEEGAHKLHLWTDSRNLDFYKHQGFTLLGKISDDYYGTDDYFFYKTLQKSDEKNFLKEFFDKQRVWKK